MLCQFTVKNYQCIKEEMTLDMQATGISEHVDRLIVCEDGELFLPLAVIYGPNGSGKSTVLHALYSLACKVMRPICAVGCDNQECIKRSGSSVFMPFKFSKETISQPTEFELFFRTEKSEYQYMLSVLRDKVVREELYTRPISSKKYTTLFVRKGASDINLKGSFRTYSCNGMSENLPLISYLGITHRRNGHVKEIVNWFEHCVEFINYGDPIEDAHITIAESGEIKDLVLKMMIEMGIDISDYRVDKNEDRMRVYTTHSVDSKHYELDLTEESNGTIKLFGMLPHIARCLLEGTTLIIDELDAKLHPVLLKYIIGLFSDRGINKKGAQLIFTSHDLSTMNSETFRRDEIWFIAKGEDQSSMLYSLIEFKHEDGRSERKDARYDKRYLEGRYGADPYLRRIIDWGEY